MKVGQDSCPICLETCNIAPSVVQPCNHSFWYSPHSLLLNSSFK